MHNRWVIIKTSDTLNCIQCFVCGFCFVWCHCLTVDMTSFAIFSWYNQLVEELTNSKAGLCDCELVRHCRHAIADKCHLLWSSWYVLQNVWQQPCVHQCFLTETSLHFLFSFPRRQYFLQGAFYKSWFPVTFSSSWYPIKTSPYKLPAPVSGLLPEISSLETFCEMLKLRKRKEGDHCKCFFFNQNSLNRLFLRLVGSS